MKLTETIASDISFSMKMIGKMDTHARKAYSKKKPTGLTWRIQYLLFPFKTVDLDCQKAHKLLLLMDVNITNKH
ncbi:hypothetical protein ALTERO38_60631 [Alteromonas sp. 38]|nr:hypothetical protein ALTER154_40163 [Alteromonas sp. 154]VXC28293.1 hypothetical protein ALTERO38_60631 [Alteromonas sp. 38]